MFCSQNKFTPNKVSDRFVVKVLSVFAKIINKRASTMHEGA